MKRALLVGLGLLVALLFALGFVPRLRDARLTLHSVLLRFGMVVGLDRENVEFQSDSVILSGTIVFPEQSQPHAAVVLIHGSGPTTRMLWLGHLFSSEGIAVLTYDKRGVGKSGGEFVDGLAAANAANFDLLAQDAAAAAAFIAQHPRLQRTPVGYAGFSQAGWIGPLAAARSPDIAFMVFFSGPVATVCEEGHFSNLAEGDPSFWRTHTRQEVAEYMKSISCPQQDVDPSPTLSRLRVPGFWAFGGQDNVMPVDLSVARLDALISTGQSQFGYRVYPEYGHEVIVFDFSKLSLSPGFREAVSWIKQTVGGHRAAAAERAR